MASKININLDTSKENYLVAKCKQNDDLTLEASIFENGLALDLTNKTITIQALKSDNTYIIQNTDIVKENNKINAELDRDFSRVPGTTKIEIVLVESSKQNTTFSFYLEVVGSVIRGAVQSSNTATILEALDNKIVEAGVVKEETEQLIESGGAAKKEDIININAQLEQKVNLINQEKFDFNLEKLSFSSNSIQLDFPTYVEKNNDVVHPSMLYFQEGWNGYKYWCAITPYTDTNNAYENPCIYCSNDGDNWIVPSGLINPIFDKPTYQYGFNSDTNLFMDKTGNKMYCIWRTRNDTDFKSKIGMLESSDGVNWTNLQWIIKSNNKDFASPCVIYENGKYKLFAVDLDSGITKSIDLYESNNPESGWTFSKNIPINVIGANRQLWHFEIRKHKGLYLMLYTVANYGNYGSSASLCFAKSYDLINWETKENVIDTNNWAKSYYKSSFLVYKDITGQDVLDLWYGSNTDGRWLVGRTQSKVYIDIERLNQNVLDTNYTVLKKDYESGYTDIFNRETFYNSNWSVSQGSFAIDSNGVYPSTTTNTTSTNTNKNKSAYMVDLLAKGLNCYIQFRRTSTTTFHRFGFDSTGSLVYQIVNNGTTTKNVKYPISSSDRNNIITVIDDLTNIKLMCNKELIDTIVELTVTESIVALQCSNVDTRIKSFEHRFKQEKINTDFIPSLTGITNVTYTRQEGKVNVNGNIVSIAYRIDGTKLDATQDSLIIKIQSNTGFAPNLVATNIAECSGLITSAVVYSKMVANDNIIYLRKDNTKLITLGDLGNTFSIMGNLVFTKG